MMTFKSTIPPSAIQVVMIVTDQVAPTVQWETTFQDEGFTTVLVTPENALNTCKVVDPALTVVDTNLPHNMRLEFCSKLRNTASGPILMLVTDYNGNDLTDIYKIGINECLLKPISPAFLVIKAISWLLRSRWFGHDTGQLHLYPDL